MRLKGYADYRKWYKLMLWKAYFDQGYGVTSYPKYAVSIIGIGAAIQNASLYWIVLGALIYGVICLIVGRLWYYFNFINAEHEVQNVVNPFVREMRVAHNNRNI